MGFCLFNNVAVAARAAQASGAARRILIVDWDLHHGNGTQHTFWEDPSVLYFSIHQFPFYPGTGSIDETGGGAGRGLTVNVPWPGGMGDAEYAAAFERILEPIASEFAPDLVLVSAGFDAAEGDPLGSMRISPAGYAAMTSRLLSLSERARRPRARGRLQPRRHLALGGRVPARAARGRGAPAPDLTELRPTAHPRAPGRPRGSRTSVLTDGSRPIAKSSPARQGPRKSRYRRREGVARLPRRHGRTGSRDGLARSITCR